jgi:hypothetical protein
MLRQGNERAQRHAADPKAAGFFDPRKRRENATSETIKNHAIQFYKDVSTKIRGESKKGRFRMDMSVKDAHAKWMVLAKLAQVSGGLGQGGTFQRSVAWFRKLRPKDVLVPVLRGNIPMSSRRRRSNKEAGVKSTHHDCEGGSPGCVQVGEDGEEEQVGAASPVIVVATAGASGQSLVDPLVPPPKWL